MGESTAPRYPGADNSAADARRFLFWKLGVDQFAAPGLFLDDAKLLEGIQRYGTAVIAGRDPAGKVETMAQLFARCIPKPVAAEQPRRRRR